MERQIDNPKPTPGFADSCSPRVNLSKSFAASRNGNPGPRSATEMVSQPGRVTIKQHLFCNFVKFLSLRDVGVVDKSLVLS